MTSIERADDMTDPEIITADQYSFLRMMYVSTFIDSSSPEYREQIETKIHEGNKSNRWTDVMREWALAV